MAMFFGRVNKSEWEHQALFANIVPVYTRGINNFANGSEFCAANGVPEWLLDLVTWAVCNMPMPYDGFMFTHVRKIEE